MRRPAPSLDPFSIVRHLAICAAAVAAYLFRAELGAGNLLLWALGLAVLVNLGACVLSDRPGWIGCARLLSSTFGVASWSLLVFLTGGARSPFVAGYALEVILSGFTLGALGPLGVTAGSIGALVASEAVLFPEVASRQLILHSGFLLATGLLASLVSRRWARAHRELATRSEELRGRLAVLESALKDARRVGVVGTQAARLAHGLKNSVHSLRGFLALLESGIPGGGREREMLAGIRQSIDRLEDLARTILRPGSLERWQPPETSGIEIHRTLNQIAKEIGDLHPEVECVAPVPAQLPDVHLPVPYLRESLFLVAQNAAEAAGPNGRVVFEVKQEADWVCIQVRDSGPGIEPSLREEIFRPGFTGKPGGSGFGLYLARSLVQSHGGTLHAEEPTGGGGTVISMRLRIRTDAETTPGRREPVGTAAPSVIG
jgi:signal transduction histidine kinase